MDRGLSGLLLQALNAASFFRVDLQPGGWSAASVTTCCDGHHKLLTMQAQPFRRYPCAVVQGNIG